jgi:hypothetical protein
MIAAIKRLDFLCLWIKGGKGFIENISRANGDCFSRALQQRRANRCFVGGMGYWPRSGGIDSPDREARRRAASTLRWSEIPVKAVKAPNTKPPIPG